MNIDIRSHIINNFKDSSEKEIEDSIVSSIEANDEIVLPGLGVLFEILWKNSNRKYQDNILKTLKKNL